VKRHLRVGRNTWKQLSAEYGAAMPHRRKTGNVLPDFGVTQMKLRTQVIEKCIFE
jgi:hypothetical protein